MPHLTYYVRGQSLPGSLFVIGRTAAAKKFGVGKVAVLAPFSRKGGNQ